MHRRCQWRIFPLRKSKPKGNLSKIINYAFFFFFFLRARLADEPSLRKSEEALGPYNPFEHRNVEHPNS